jgi:hypothetical protein
MQQFFSLLSWRFLKLNMFRAFSRPLSGAQWLQWQPLVLPLYRSDSRAVFVVGPAHTLPDNVQQLHVWQPSTVLCKTICCLCSFKLLMMGGVSSETCWASFKIRKNKILITLLHLVGFFTVRIVINACVYSVWIKEKNNKATCLPQWHFAVMSSRQLLIQTPTHVWKHVELISSKRPACVIVNCWAISINKSSLVRYWTCYTLGGTLISPPPPMELSVNGRLSFASIRSIKFCINVIIKRYIIPK